MPYSILIDGDIQTFLCENSLLIKLLEYFESIRSTVKLKAMEIACTLPKRASCAPFICLVVKVQVLISNPADNFSLKVTAISFCYLV